MQHACVAIAHCCLSTVARRIDSRHSEAATAVTAAVTAAAADDDDDAVTAASAVAAAAAATASAVDAVALAVALVRS
jgi:hypothetical protein